MFSRVRLCLALAFLATTATCAVVEETQSAKAAERLIDLKEDVSPCGGLGVITDIRIPSCTTFPCQLRPGSYLAEVNFVPTHSHHEDLNVEAVLTPSDQSLVPVFTSGPFNMKITKGHTYTLTYMLVLPMPFDLPSGIASLRLTFVGSSGVMEVCADLTDMFEI